MLHSLLRIFVTVNLLIATKHVCGREDGAENLLSFYKSNLENIFKIADDYDASDFLKDPLRWGEAPATSNSNENRIARSWGFTKARDEYDFIIVGSGSAGCALANRLSEIGNWQVLLLEAGRPAGLIAKVPIFAPSLYFTDLTHKYMMEYQPNFAKGFHGGIMGWPRGRALGGTSIINYMIYTRGHPTDFDRWAANGNPGWSYNDVLPYFIKSEKANNLSGIDPQYHGFNGPLSVSDSFRTPLAASFIQAGKELGYEEVDYTGPKVYGFSTIKTTTYHGKRHDVASAFLYPYLGRKNLHIKPLSYVTKILIDTNNTAYGVRYTRLGQMYTAYARKEVIISAGAFSSPHLLMLSGIGPADQLEKFNIPSIKNLNVGQNLQDHFCYMGLPLLVNDTTAMSIKDLINPYLILKYLATGNGPLASIGGPEALGYIKTSESDETGDYPDIELIFAGAYVTTDSGTFTRRSWGISTQSYNAYMARLHGKRVFTIMPMLLHPKSVGRLELRSKNPFAPPKFYGNYVSDRDNKDMKTMIAAMKFILELIKTPAFKQHGVRVNDIPVPGCENKQGFDEYWDCALRTFSVTLHHQVGTCKMGPSTDPTAVVDPRLRVHGINKLRVADTSIIPFALSAHTNAPSVMVGEKAADILKEDWGVLNANEK